jgi:dihydroflavonol-4-reductase
MSSKVFVTGADGLLGSNLVRELLKRNYSITVLSQKGRHVKTLDGLSLEKVEGDLLDKDSLRKGMSGCDYVIHVAASTSVWPTRSETTRKINIEGTRNVMQLSLELKIQRVVYIGTASTFSFGSKENPGKEDSPYISAKYGMDYMDSKYEAHKIVKSFVKEGLPVIIVNPTFMLGPYDSAPSSGAMILGLYHGKVPGYVPGGRNYVCVKDVAVGISNALTMGRIGESYILGNQNLNYKEAFLLMANVLEVKVPIRRIPKWFMLTYGMICSWLGIVFRKRPAVSYNLAKISCDEHYFSSAKAVEELKLPQSPIEEGIKDAMIWFKENDYLKK